VRTTRLTGRHSSLPAATVAGALVYSWFAAALHPFTWPENVAVAIPVLLVLVALVRSWGRPKDGPEPDHEHARARRMAGAVWVGLVTVLVAWELTAYFSSPRADHPTLSTVADDIMSSHPGRAAMFALWLALGWLLFVRSPTPQR
jgi:hypothetical protein